MPKTHDMTLAAAWEKVRNLVFRTAAEFHRAHGGDAEVIAADATYYFVRAFLKWEPARSRLTTWVRKFVWRELFEDYRKEQHRRRLLNHRVDLSTVCRVDDALVLAELYATLSDDGREVLRELVSDPAAGVRAAAGRLKASRGWKRERTMRAVRELREAV